jgi:hypothetical protein
MSSKRKLVRELARLKADFELPGDGNFEYFVCPILLTDENVELCMGHVISQTLPNCCRKMVVQRKDIDGFYGSVCEAAFKTMVDVHRAKSEGRTVLEDRNLRRALPLTVKIGEQTIDFYEVKQHTQPTHALVELRDGERTAFKLALKVSAEDIPPAGNMQLIVNRDFLPEMVATLLKMAHLTQFAIFGYQYVFGAAGLMLAEILRTFFVENKNKPRDEQTTAAIEYFPNHAGMVMPVVGYDKNVLKGSIEDRRFLVCCGSSGAWYAFGVFIRIDDQMHVVLVPTDTADSVGTYFDLIKDMHTKTFKFQLLEFVPATESESAYWKVGEQEYTFRSHPDFC